MTAERQPNGRWIFKTEPDSYSFDDLLRKKRDIWDGVRNHVALKHLRNTSVGDPVLIYHTGSQRALVGLARVTRAAHADPSSDDPKMVVVEIAADRPLTRPVPLSEIKADPLYRDFDLVRLGRLSVIPVPEALWSDLIRRAEG